MHVPHAPTSLSPAMLPVCMGTAGYDHSEVYKITLLLLSRRRHKICTDWNTPCEESRPPAQVLYPKNALKLHCTG